MHLRSGAFYRSGNQSISNIRSRASTQESAARSQFQATVSIEEVVSNTYSNSSMETRGSLHVNQPDIALDYNTKITYVRDNLCGALVYRDPQNRFLIKIEDQHTDYEATPFVNYQGDRYIGQQGEMYLVVEESRHCRQSRRGTDTRTT